MSRVIVNTLIAINLDMFCYFNYIFKLKISTILSLKET